MGEDEWELQADGSYIQYGPTGEPDQIIPPPTKANPKPTPVRIGSKSSSTLVVVAVAAVALLVLLRKR